MLFRANRRVISPHVSHAQTPDQKQRPEDMKTEIQPSHEQSVTRNSIGGEGAIDVPGENDREDSENQGTDRPDEGRFEERFTLRGQQTSQDDAGQ